MTDRYERHESPTEQLDRHWSELLQELRLAQTGTQILFAFLLTIAFSVPFQSSGGFTHGVFAVTLVAAALAMCLFLAPVAFHRIVFQHKLRDLMVPIAGRLTAAGLFMLVIAIAGGLLLALDVVLPRATAITVTAVVVACFVALWYLLPLWVRRLS